MAVKKIGQGARASSQEPRRSSAAHNAARHLLAPDSHQPPRPNHGGEALTLDKVKIVCYNKKEASDTLKPPVKGLKADDRGIFYCKNKTHKAVKTPLSELL